MKIPLKAVFLDRDGTINKDVNFCRKVEDFKLLPNVPEAIGKLNQHGFKVIVITNQSGIGRKIFTEGTLSMIHQHMKDELKMHNAYIDAIYYCPHHPDENCECRKPKPKLLLQAIAEHGVTPELSYMIGDGARDVASGKAVGCKSILLQNNPDSIPNSDTVQADFIAKDLLDGVDWIINRCESVSH